MQTRLDAMLRLRRSVLLMLTLLLVSGCLPENTCSGGQNMTDPRVSGSFDPNAVDPLLRIGWDAGTELGARLPEAYFEAARVSPSTSEAADVLEGVTYVSRFELQVPFSDLSQYARTHETLEFSLAFPDRRRYVDCDHPGRNDVYLLEVRLAFEPTTGAFEGATFEQRVLPGGI